MSQPDIATAVVFCAPLTASALALAAAHWFPWHGGARPLSRTSAYAVGTSIIVGAPVAAMLLATAAGLVFAATFWAALLVANVLVGGAVVNLGYWIDAHSRPVTLDDVREAQNAARGR